MAGRRVAQLARRVVEAIEHATPSHLGPAAAHRLREPLTPERGQGIRDPRCDRVDGLVVHSEPERVDLVRLPMVAADRAVRAARNRMLVVDVDPHGLLGRRLEVGFEASDMLIEEVEVSRTEFDVGLDDRLGSVVAERRFGLAAGADGQRSPQESRARRPAPMLACAACRPE